MARGTQKRSRDVMVLNASFEYQGVCTLNNALTDLWLENVWSLREDPEEMFFGPIQPDGTRLEYPRPHIVVYYEYNEIDYEHIKPMDPVMATRMAILNRDNWTCAYCGGFGDELEHILPESRGGSTTWVNCVAACRKCNAFKADRTPEEAQVYLEQKRNDPTLSEALRDKLPKNMKLLWQPSKPPVEKWMKEQEKIWKLLESGEVTIPERRNKLEEK